MGEYAVRLDSVGSGTEGTGEKAKRIGSMLSAGLPVPSGFVLKAGAYVKFLRHNKIAAKIQPLVEESHSASIGRVKEISVQIQNMILNGIMPDFIDKAIKEEYQDLSIGREAKEIGGAALDLIKAGRDNAFVAVRPSPEDGGMASANFSGQMKTMVYMRGQQQITDAIKEVWASMFSLRAMLYRKRKRVREMPAMAVIIQKSIESEKSGFVYTSVPETGDSSRIVIEGSWGFSDSIISGTVTPDEYVISKETGKPESRKVNKKTWMNRINEMTGKITREPVFRERVEAEILDQKELSKLMELAARIENHFGGHPQEIEWAEERGRIFIIDAGHIPNYGINHISQEGPEEQGQKVAQGVCACRGLAKGKARVFSSIADMERIEKGDILVTTMTIPELVAVMDSVSGVITQEGSRSCHAAVLSREFGIPCIVSASGVASIEEGQDIILNASGGVATKTREPVPQQPYQGVPGQPAQPIEGQVLPSSQYNPVYQHDAQHSEQPQPQETSGGEPHGIPRGLDEEGITATGIRAIVSVPGNVGRSPELSDGAGLVRAEHMITEAGKHPFWLIRNNPEEIIASMISGLGSIAKQFYPKPVWYRSIDIRSDEFRELEGGEHEQAENNPIMGWHGIRRSLDQPELLKIELEIIERLYKEGLSNIALGIPFISSMEEFRQVKQLVRFPLKLGVMIETPAAGLEIENLCMEGISFAAIGLNDLTQLTLGVDRDNSRISKLYSELNPAVINLLKHILRTCRKYSVETSVYGDFVSDPRIAEPLVKLGVGSISTEPENLEDVRSIISRTERKIILESMRDQPHQG